MTKPEFPQAPRQDATDTLAMGARRATSPAHGFTVLELVIVAAIVAMLAALVVPRFGGAVAGYRVDAAARRVAADLNYARTHARMTSTPQSVTFEVGASKYAFANLPSPDRSQSAYTVSLAQPPYETTIESVDFDTKATLVFSAFGQPDSGGEIRLICSGLTRTVTVNGTTGEASTE